jgi:hypothetical protein
MIYKPKNFRIEELVPKKVFDLYGGNSWWFVNPKISWSLQEIRDYINHPVLVNDWLWKGNRQNQCLRTVDYYTEFSLSQHLFGNACDIQVAKLTGDEMRDMVKAMKKQRKLQHVTAIEDKVNWLHFDCRPSFKPEELIIFNP